MIVLLSAVAMAAAAPVATQPTTPDHAGHNAPQTEQRGKGCCCCKDKTSGDTQANGKKMECCENKQRDATPAEHSQHNH